MLSEPDWHDIARWEAEGGSNPKLSKEGIKIFGKQAEPTMKNGKGHIDPKINSCVRIRMEGMKTFLNFFPTQNQ